MYTYIHLHAHTINEMFIRISSCIMYFMKWALRISYSLLQVQPVYHLWGLIKNLKMNFIMIPCHQLRSTCLLKLYLPFADSSREFKRKVTFKKLWSKTSIIRPHFPFYKMHIHEAVILPLQGIIYICMDRTESRETTEIYSWKRCNWNLSWESYAHHWYINLWSKCVAYNQWSHWYLI